MLKDLLKEGGLYTIANLLTKGVGLLLIPFYTAYFSTFDYGIIDILSVFGGIVSTIISLQLNQGMARYVSDGETTSIEKKRIASTAIIIVISIYLGFGIFITFFPELFVSSLSNDEAEMSIELIKLGIYATVLNGVFYFLGVYLRSLRRVNQFTILSFFFAISNTLLMIYLILSLGMGIKGIYVSNIIISPVFAIISLYLLRKDIIFFVGKAQLSALLKYSIPLVPAALAFLLMNTIDRIYLKDMLSFDDTGVYGIASKFSSIITIIIAGFTMAMNPIVFGKYKDENAKKEIANIFNYFFVFGSLGLLILSLFSFETVYVFTNTNFYGASQLMPIMYLSVLLSGLSMFSLGINIAKKTKVGALIVILSSALNAFLNYWFILWFGALGAALSTLISVTIFYLFYLAVSQKYYRINFSFGKKTPILLLNLVLIYVGAYFLDLNFWLSILVKLLFVIVYMTILYVYFVKSKVIKIKRN